MSVYSVYVVKDDYNKVVQVPFFAESDVKAIELFNDLPYVQDGCVLCRIGVFDSQRVRVISHSSVEVSVFVSTKEMF